MGGSIERARAELAGRLRDRRGEIEAAILTRTYALADSAETANPEYAQGLRAAVSAAIEAGLVGIERGEERGLPVPVLLLAQARLAARNGVPLDTVLRRYFAGYSLLVHFMVEEASKDQLVGGAVLQRLLASQATLFDRLLAAIGEEHMRESETLHLSSGQRRAKRIERLLAGEMLDTSELEYDFTAHHVGLVAIGTAIAEPIREVAASLDRRLLLAQPDEDTVWAWLGGRRGTDPAELLSRLYAAVSERAVVTVGEPGEGLSGWRLTHQQASAAIAIAQRGPRDIVRYADVALLASVLQDDLLAASLRQLYLKPLDEERDGGVTLRKTLRAYLAAAGSLSSAASALGVSRRTVSNRLLKVEERIGHPLSTVLTEVETALRMEEFDAAGDTSRIAPSSHR